MGEKELAQLIFIGLTLLAKLGKLSQGTPCSRAKDAINMAEVFEETWKNVKATERSEDPNPEE